jgi:hypothetical protein
MRVLMYNNEILNPRPEIRTTVEECMEQGIDIMTYLPKYRSTPLFLALDELHEPEIIQLLIKNGHDIAKKTPYYDTVYDSENMSHITINRYNSIENIILRHYYLLNNDYNLDNKIIEKYKQQPNYEPPCIIRASTIVYKKTHLEKKPRIDEDSSDDESLYAEGCEPKSEEEIIKHNNYMITNMKGRVYKYCEIFNINIDALIEKGEVYPDDLCYPRI